MMLFIHGFGSCGWGAKSLVLRRHVGVEKILAPDLPFHPQRAVERLHDILDRYSVHSLVGASLGGFYATCLNAQRKLPTILINPVVRPHLLLRDHPGRQRRWCDNAEFHVDTAYIDTLRQLQRESLDTDERYLVLLQQGDEVLDYRDAATYYRDKDVISLPGGDHRFADFAQQLPGIDAWLARHPK